MRRRSRWASRGSVQGDIEAMVAIVCATSTSVPALAASIRDVCFSDVEIAQEQLRVGRPEDVAVVAAFLAGAAADYITGQCISGGVMH